MGLIIDNPLIQHLANWAWDADPSPLVTPTTCLESLPMLSAPCLTRLIAKGVGIGIIFASCINKAPVIRNILKSSSVAGLSVGAAYGEVIMYSNAAFYNILNGNPFTAYGETFSVLLQQMIVVTLIWYYSSTTQSTTTTQIIGKKDVMLAIVAYGIYLYVVFQVLPTTQYIYMLMVYNPVVLVTTRGAQIRSNYTNKQTGAQSLATTTMNLTGSLVRVATTIKEVGWDYHILRSYGTSITLNAILFAQILMYKANTEKFLKSLKEKKKD